MKQIILENIIKLKELNDYLNSTDIRELSLSCKSYRNILSSVVFRCFNFSKFANFKAYKSGVITKDDYRYNEIRLLLPQTRANEYSGQALVPEYYIQNPYKPLAKECLESKPKFINDLSQARFKVKKLNFFSFFIHDYLIYELPTVFSNINTIHIHHSTMLFEAFQHLLDNLFYLEDLELYETNLLKCRVDSNPISVNWPLSLKKLKVGGNSIGLINEGDNYIEVYEGNYLKINFTGFILRPKHLPNLESLIIKPSVAGVENNDTYDNDNDILEFLRHNNHIKELTISFYRFQVKLLEIIISFTNLTNLILPNFYQIDINDYTVTKSNTLYNIIRLELFLYSNISKIDSIAQQYPSLTYLTVGFGSMELAEFNIFISKLNKFKNLTKLNLRLFNQFVKIENLNFPSLENLKTLEIFCKSYHNFEEFKWNVDCCPNLKIVKFTKDYDFEYPRLNSKILNNWDFAYFPQKLSFYRKRK